MAIAMTLKQYLESHGAQYEIVPHVRTTSSLATAHAAHVPAGCLAKSVILEDDRGFVMAVLPASHRLEIESLRALLHRRVGLATESQVAGLFRDCEVGAIPALGSAYGLDVIVDDSLAGQPEVYFEAGDHRELIHTDGRQFKRLLPDAQRGHFSARAD